MNWLLPLIILEIITINWAAPIDLLDLSGTHKPTFAHLNNSTLAQSIDANNFPEKSLDLVLNTEALSNNAALNEILNANLHKISDDVQTQPDDTDIEGKVIEEKIKFLSTSPRPWESTTDGNEAFTEDTTSFNDHESQPVASSQHILSTVKEHLSQLYTQISNKIENYPTEIPLSLNNTKIQNEILQRWDKVNTNTDNSTQSESSFDATTHIVEPQTITHTSTNSNISVESIPATTEPFTEIINQNAVSSPNETFLESIAKNSQFTAEKFNDGWENLLNQNKRLTETITESKQHSASRPDSDMVKDLQTTVNDLMSVTQISDPKEISIHHDPEVKPPANNSVTDEKQLAQEDTTIPYATESNSEKPVHHHTTVDSFVNQVTTLDHSTATATEEYPSVIHTTSEHSNTPVTHGILNETITKTETDMDSNFKHELEFFMENVMGIDSKLDMRSEHINEEIVPRDEKINQVTNSLVKEDNINLTSNLELPFASVASILKKTDENLQSNKTDATTQEMSETITTRDILKDAYNNKSSEVSNSFRSMEHLIASASINTANANKAEGATKNGNESSMERVNQGQQSTLTNFNSHLEVSSRPASVENVSNTTKNDVVDQESTQELTTIKATTESTETSKESIADVDSDAKEMPIWIGSQKEQNKTPTNQDHLTANTTQQPEIATHLETTQSEDFESSTIGKTKSFEYNKLNASGILNNEADKIDFTSHTNRPYDSTSYPLMQTTATGSHSHSVTEQTTRPQENYSTSITPIVTTTATTYNEDPTTPASVENIKFEQGPQVTITTTGEAKQDEIIKSTVAAAENSKLPKTTTLCNHFDEQTIYTQREDETTGENSILEDLRHSGAIRQNFIDKFADYYEQDIKDIVAITETQKQVTEPQEIGADSVTSTELALSLTTEISQQDQVKLSKVTTTQQNETDGDTQTTTVENGMKDENTATTEYISEATFTYMLPNTTLRADTASSTTEFMPTTILTAEATEDPITAPSWESFPQQTFDSTTYAQPMAKENKEPLVTSRPEETLTQTSPVQESQYKIESTTVADASTQTPAVNGENSNTESIELQASEAGEQTSTALVTEEEEIVTTTSASVELEARSLSLPPPKYEYLQSADGVEVFYGYSIVKHN